ncbi:uncharacterized protein [Miscanthus floridulus]|uniref:uncharacterized protein n=1 Tax=Miscanthus floridulus TaxID=154761 RepID=UPI0034591954
MSVLTLTVSIILEKADNDGRFCESSKMFARHFQSARTKNVSDKITWKLSGIPKVSISQGTKMEVVAYGDETMRFDRLLRVGECYDFMRVGFAPTHVGPLGYIFRLCVDYVVVLSP